MNENTRKKALIVRRLMSEHYQPERHDKCKRWVWRNYINPVMPMAERTFYRYINMKLEEDHRKEDHRQLKLFE